MDVFCTSSAIIPPGAVKEIALGMEVALPAFVDVVDRDICVRLPCPAFTFITRSSAIARGIFVLPTLIDNGYRGPLFLFAMNVGDKAIPIATGDRIAQLVMLTNLAGQLEIKEAEFLPSSDRGVKGFGSSGGGI
jgi:dUTPase